MNNSTKVLAAAAALAVVALVGIGVGMLVTKGKGDTPAPVAAAQPPSRPAADSAPPTPALPAIPRATAPTFATPGATNVETAVPVANTSTNWEDRLDAILGADTGEKEKAKQLLEMFPSLGEDGQVEVAQHLSNLVEDEDYPALGRYVTNSALPEQVLDVLLSDALNRPNSLKLPLLLQVAENPQHPKASEAKDLLELYLEEDYGGDWARWQAAMDAWLRDNPD